jgi:hypothetical protein
MKKSKPTAPEHKLLNEEQFAEVFLKYLRLVDELDAFTRNNMDQIKSIRYHVDIGLEEHPDLCRQLYRKYEAEKTEKENESNQNLGNLG